MGPPMIKFCIHGEVDCRSFCSRIGENQLHDWKNVYNHGAALQTADATICGDFW